MSITGNPKVSLSLLAAKLASTVKGRNDLICGSLATGATAVAGTLYTDIGQYTETQLDSLFVINSDLRNRIAQFKDSNGGYSQLNVKGVAEAGTGVNAVGSIVFGTGVGVATSEGSVIVTLVDEYQFKVTIPVVVGDTDVTITAKIISAYASANFPNMPVVVTAGVNTHTTTITAVDKGTIGNYFPISVTVLATGLGAIAVTAMATGANDSVLTTYFDNLQSTRFTGINWPTAWGSSLSVVKTYLDNRFNTANSILDGVAFLGLHETFANAKIAVNAHNSPSIVVGGNTTNVKQPADWVMAYFQGIRARRLTLNAPISQFITTTSGALDIFGGSALASLPYFNTPMAQIAVVDPNSLYSEIEQGELEEAGYTVIGVNPSENLMITAPVVTTYKTDSAGNENDSFHYLNYVDTSSICREYMYTNLKARFSQSRLTNGALVVGRSMENEASIRMEIAKEYKDLSLLALTVAGQEAEKFFLANLSVVLDLVTRSATVTMQLPIVTQLGYIVATMQLNFNFKQGA